jgi:diguanylate cyclase (GGDEF)-like protein
MPDTTTDREWRVDTASARPATTDMRELPRTLGTQASPPETAHGLRGRGSQIGDAWRRSTNRVHFWVIARLRQFAGRARSSYFEGLLRDFIEVIDTADDPAVLERSLVRLAGQLVPAYRVELVTAPGAACVYEANAAVVGTGSESPDRHLAESDNAPVHAILDVPLRCGRVLRGRLRVRPRARDVASLRNETVEQLTALCTLSACALERLDLEREWPRRDLVADAEHSSGTELAAIPTPKAAGVFSMTQLRDATFLHAVLPFALSQARRHNETLSLVCVSIDRLGAIQELLGRAAVDRLVESVGETVATLIRASDIVARLDDDRVIAVLPRAPGGGALHVAQRICQAVAEKTLGDSEIPRVTVSVGVACFPLCAEDVFSLFDAADEALERAQSQGRNQAVLAHRLAIFAPGYGKTARSTSAAT